MSVSSLPVGKFQFPWRVRKGAILRARGNVALTAALEASLARERASQQANAVLLQSQRTRALEFDHRFLNGLQWITALLTLQSRGATPEVAEQLAIAARRVAAFGSVHRRLHLLDNQRTAEFGQFLRALWARTFQTYCSKVLRTAIPSRSKAQRLRWKLQRRSRSGSSSPS
jgi:two-component sensor histidine kinase